MRRIMFFMAVAIAATAAALAVATPSQAHQSFAYKWFTPSATAVAGPNHTFTFTVNLTNSDVKTPAFLWGACTAGFMPCQLGLSHTAEVDVTIGTASGFVTHSYVVNLAPVRPGLPPPTWKKTFTGVAMPGIKVGIDIVASHYAEASDDAVGIANPNSNVAFYDVEAVAKVVVR